MKVFENLRDLAPYVGQQIGTSNWLLITQERVNQFAKVAGDDQWIHVDVERAKKESPFGQTIVHGFLTLAFAPKFVQEIFIIKNFKMKINYGLNKIRFPSALLVGSRVRMHLELMEYRELKGSVETVIKYVFECEGQEKPVCVAEQINRWI